MRRIPLGVAIAFISFMTGTSTARVWNFITEPPPASVISCTFPHTTSQSSDEVNPVAEAEIRELFRQFAIAQTNHDEAFFERVEADSYTVVTRWGQTFTKAAIIADMKTWDTSTRYAYESLDVQLYGDVAVVKGALTATNTYNGHSSSTTWRSIYLLTKMTGQWQILSTTQLK